MIEIPLGDETPSTDGLSFRSKRKGKEDQSIDVEKAAFRRLIASIHDPEKWQTFREFMVNEIHEQDRKKSEYEIAPVRGQESTFQVLKTRISWLVTLMLLQSFSSMIMDRYSSMLNQHIVVATFVTTLIGTGGNAGNQVISYVISGLSTGRISKRPRAVLMLLRRELVHAVMTGLILASFMFLRVYFSVWQMDVTLALTLSMFFIVSFSVLFGLSVPLVLTSLGMDTSSGAAPVLATLMDVVGVAITCSVSYSYLKNVIPITKFQ